MRLRRVVSLALALSALMLPCAVHAQTAQDARLRSAIAAYETGELSRSLALLDSLPPVLPARDQAVRYVYRGLIKLALGDAASARANFVGAIQAEPTVRVDPALHAPSRVRAYIAALDSVVGAWRALAMAAEDAGDLETARQHWGRVSLAMPSDTLAPRRLAAILERQARGAPVQRQPSPGASAPTARAPSPEPVAPDSGRVSTGVRRFDTSTAVALGLLLPGLGEVYVGRPGRGLLVLGAVAGAVALGVLNETVSVECLTVPVNNFCPPGDVVSETVEKPYLVPAIGAAVAITALGAIDAYIAARRANARAAGSEGPQSDRAGLRLEFPAVQPAPDNVRVEIVRVRF